MPRALNLLRPGLHRRRDAFDRGLQAAGFVLAADGLPDPGAGDLLVIWNRYGAFSDAADRFEACGARVLVAENCPFGNAFQGGAFSIAGRHVAIAGGDIIDGGPERWDAWGVDLRPWRDLGGDIVVLEQRGIGHESVRSPRAWAEGAARSTGGRIRRHPGDAGTRESLAADLRRASGVITWASAAAIQSLALGVPVWHEHPGFVGASASMPLSDWPGLPRRDDAARLAMLRRLAWAIWTLPEIESGAPFARLASA